MSYFGDIYERAILPVSLQLISLESRRRIRTIIDVLPKEYGLMTFGFECPLHEASADADFLVSSDVTNDGPSIMMHASAAGSEFPDSVFEKVREFGSYWKGVLSNKQSDPAPLIDDVWLEYDLIAHPESFPVPGIFFRTASNIEKDGDALHLDVIVDFLCRTYFDVKKTYPSTLLRRQLEACVVSEGDNKNVKKSIYIGMMLSRKSSGLRLVVGFASSEALLSFLRDSGWPGPLTFIKPFVDEWYQMVDMVTLNVDIGEDGLGIKLGFELSFNCRRPPEREPRWALLLDYLVEKGMCCPSKVQGLITYAGYEEYPGMQGIMAESSDMELLKDACRMFVVRKLFHIKVVYDGTPSLFAKGYLGVTPYFRRWDIFKEATSLP